MNPVLIFTDTTKIQAEKNSLTKAIPIFQAVYTAFKDINISVSIPEINNLINWAIGGNGGAGFVKEFAINKLLDVSGPYTFGGITLSREKVKEIMVMPNTDAIELQLRGVFNLYNGVQNRGTRIELLLLENDVISKAATAETQIETIYTYYTKTDASAEIANDLIVVCNAMNSFDDAHGDKLKQGSHQANVDYGFPGSSLPYAIKLHDGEFVINLDFIRSFESQNS